MFKTMSNISINSKFNSFKSMSVSSMTNSFAMDYLEQLDYLRLKQERERIHLS